MDIGGGNTDTVIRFQRRAIGCLVDACDINPGVNVSRWEPILSVADPDQAVARA